MKKKLVTLLFTAVMMLSLPAMAFAAPSPSNPDTPDPHGASNETTSPKTGMDLTVVAGVTVLSLAGAGATAFALRRNNQE